MPLVYIVQLCIATSVEYINTVHTVIIEGYNFADTCHPQIYPLLTICMGIHSIVKIKNEIPKILPCCCQQNIKPSIITMYMIRTIAIHRAT